MCHCVNVDVWVYNPSGREGKPLRTQILYRDLCSQVHRGRESLSVVSDVS